MILPDVNVLVCAFRSDAKDHSSHRVWLQGVIDGPSVYGISPQVLASLIRICTHRRIFVRPSSLTEAFEFCRILTSPPHCSLVVPGPRHWEIFKGLCASASAVGNLVQDAWFAALAIESGCEWITTDRDYARFEGLKSRPPF